MSKARLVITAVTLENRPVAQVAADYGVARSRRITTPIVTDTFPGTDGSAETHDRVRTDRTP